MPTVFSRRTQLPLTSPRHAGWWISTWLPPIIAMIVIACESTPTFSAGNTSSWLRPIFERWFFHVSDSAWDLGHHIFRKSGHFIGYGLVGLTFLRAWLRTFGRRHALSLAAWRWQSSLAGIACTFLVASADEWHQTFLPSRTGMFSDVLLDTAGATTMILLVALLRRWFRPLHRAK